VKYLVIGVIMCMLIHVARKITTPEPLGSPYLRRRVIVELTPQELPLLEEAERRHGTKRQAIVSALEAASQSAELEQELAGAQAERTRVEAELETLSVDQAAAEKARERLARDLKKARSELASTKESAGSSSRGSEQRLQALERLLDEREEEIKELEEQVFDKLFCARCGKWISPENFAWTDCEGGAYAYHQACGDHGSELMKPSSWLGWQSDSWPSPRAAESREHPQEGLACLHLMRQLSNPGPEVRNLDQYRPDDEPSTRMTCLIIA
jgi:hypothetical protein